MLFLFANLRKSRKNITVNNKKHGSFDTTLVLQEDKIWRDFLGKDVITENHSCELYFEERDIEAFIHKLERLYPSVRYVNRLMTHSWGRKVIRFYDPDGNLIEVGTPAI